MKPVEFGDCFILSENLKHLIVDCGSTDESAVVNSGIYDKIECLRNNGSKLELLISHFDSDHYNGILKINKETFEKIYFPYCLMNRYNEFCSTIGYLILLNNSNIPPESIRKELSDKLVELLTKLPQILKSNGKLVSLCSGRNFPLGTQQFNVIWPPNGQSPFQKPLKRVLEGLNDKVKEKIQPLVKSLRVFFNKLNEKELEIDEIETLTGDIKKEYERLRNQHNN